MAIQRFWSVAIQHYKKCSIAGVQNHSIHICIYNGNTYIFQILRWLLYMNPVLGELSAYDEPKCSARYTVFSATAGH